MLPLFDGDADARRQWKVMRIVSLVVVRLFIRGAHGSDYRTDTRQSAFAELPYSLPIPVRRMHRIAGRVQRINMLLREQEDTRQICGDRIMRHLRELGDFLLMRLLCSQEFQLGIAVPLPIIDGDGANGCANRVRDDIQREKYE